jgi:hypothetical protein
MLHDDLWLYCAVRNQMEHSQYCHFLSRPNEGTDTVVLPARDSELVGYLLNQV